MKKILILGSTGFIGRNLTEFFSKKKNTKVFATYNKRAKFKQKNVVFLKCNLLNKEKVNSIIKDKDIVIMAAATTSGAKDIIERPYIHVTDNVIMNSIVLRSCYENNIKHVIFLSCTVMYHSQKNKIKEKSLDLNKPIYPNYFGGAWMKIFSEKSCEFYSRLSKNKFTVIRHSNVYGPHDKFDLNKSHVFGATMTKVLTSRDSVINIWGDGKEKRDLLYIEDLLNFINLVIKRQKGKFEIFNVGYGKLISINNLVKKIGDIAKIKVNLKHDFSKVSLKTNVLIDCNLAKKKIGWKIQNTLDTGIKKTILWYRKNLLSNKNNL